MDEVTRELRTCYTDPCEDVPPLSAEDLAQMWDEARANVPPVPDADDEPAGEPPW